MSGERGPTGVHLASRSDSAPVGQALRGQFASRASNAADAIQALGRVEAPAKVQGAYLIPHSSQAGSATNFADVKLVNLGTGGAGTTVIGSRSLSAAGQGVAAGAAGALTLASAAQEVAEGDVLALSYVSQGNGIALVAHSFQVEYAYL